MKVIEYVKCEQCDKTFGRTQTGIGWLLRRANHNTLVHGADITLELEKI
jgi:hypothetical protein